jgi:phosphate-selective porin OprO/OprP
MVMNTKESDSGSTLRLKLVSAPKTIALCAVFVLSFGLASRGEETASTAELLQRLKSLESEVKELRAERAVAKETPAPKPVPTITLGGEGLGVRSADTNFVLAIHGLVQLDTRSFVNDNPKTVGNDQFLLRRARVPIIQGTLFRDIDFYFMPEFGGSTVQIVDAYANYRICPQLQLRAGKFKPPVGLENLQSDPNLAFNERSIATDLVPNRDLGVQLWGDLWGGRVNYAAGVFNGSTDYSGTAANTDTDDSKSFDARLFFQPFKQGSVKALKNLGFGVGGSIQTDHGSTNSGASGLTAGFTTDGQQKFFSYNPTNGIVYSKGTHWRLSPQGYYYYGPLSLVGEYVISDQQVRKSTGPSARLRNSAWEVTAGWVLTGETVSYGGLVPKNAFNPREGHWGALQLVGRISELDVDDATFPTFSNPDTSASRARAWAVGLNWYLNRNLRINTSFSRTTFSGGNGSKAVVTAQPEQVVFTRMQFAF